MVLVVWSVVVRSMVPVLRSVQSMPPVAQLSRHVVWTGSSVIRHVDLGLD